MEDTPESPKSAPAATSGAAAPRKPRAKASARRSTAPAKRSAAASKVRNASTRRKAPIPRSLRAEGLEAMLDAFAKSASRAGASVSAVSGKSVRSAKRAWNRAGVASKSTVKRVLKEWKSLDSKRRASYVAALLGALAAASAPIVRSRLKKR